MLQTLVHYTCHFLVIGIIAYFYDPKQWKKGWLILLATMLVDIDHLFANPIFEAGRCSIGFHYLHSEYVIPFYILGALFIKQKIVRLIFIGLVFHMITDFVDCLWMFSKCDFNCKLPDLFKLNIFKTGLFQQ